MTGVDGRTTGRVWRAGWYLLSLRLSRPAEIDDRLHLQVQRGADEEALQLALTPGSSRQRIPIRLPDGVRTLGISDDALSFSLRRLPAPERWLRDVWAASLSRWSNSVARVRADELTRALRHGGPRSMVALLIGNTDALRVIDYLHWIARIESQVMTDSRRVRASIEQWRHKPLISILMPVFNPDRDLLARAVDSLRRQSYPHWELCIADDASNDASVRQWLHDLQTGDARLRCVFRETNGHIAEASNSALAMATGEYVGLLDQDDELAANALFHIVEYLNACPSARIIYSDEDKLDAKGRRVDPYFKPDWNPELILAQNYVSHFGVYSTALLRQVGGFRKGFEGSQDHDLLLRCSEVVAADDILHVPRVLYHWRAGHGSTASDPEAKPYARDAARRAVAEHLRRRGIRASVVDGVGGYQKVQYELPESLPLVSVIIPTRDRLDLLRPCVESLLEKTAYTSYEVLIMDNGSRQPETLRWLAEIAAADCRVRVLRDDRDFNFSALNNHAAEHASGDFLLFLNNDIRVRDAGWLAEMVAVGAQPGIAAVGAKLYYPDGRIQHAGVILGYQGVAGHAYQGEPGHIHGQMGRARLRQDVGAVTAACMLVQTTAFHAADGFDEQLAVAFNDIDLCLRLRANGGRIVWTPYAELTHHESASRGREDNSEKRARFHAEADFICNRWDRELTLDRAYNPSLALTGSTFRLTFDHALVALRLDRHRLQRVRGDEPRVVI